MAERNLVKCRGVGCNKTTRNRSPSMCDPCRKKKQRKDFSKYKVRNPAEYQFYRSQRWRKLSAAHKRKEPLCRECKERGVVTAAEYTDHIVPIREGGSKWDSSNYQSLCSPCHSRKSGEENRRRSKSKSIENTTATGGGLKS